MPDQEFHLKPSNSYLIFLGIVMFVSLSVVLLLPLHIGLKALGFVWLVIYSAHICWRYGLLRSKHSILSIRCLASGKWLLNTRTSSYTGDISKDTTVTGLASVLRFKVAKKAWPMSCIVFRDSLDATEYRRLLVVLKAR